MLTKRDIDWLKSELIPALSDRVKKDLSDRLDWISSMLDKQSGNLAAIQTELTFISAPIDGIDTDKSQIKKRIERMEKKLTLPPLAD